MKVKCLRVLLPVAALLAAFVGLRADSPGSERQSWRADLDGYQVVPSVYTKATGTIKLKVTDSGDLGYELNYSDLASSATSAVLVFGQPGTNGTYMAYLCGGLSSKQCPLTSGTVSGTLIPSNILPANGVAAGSMAQALDVIRAGAAYVTVLTSGRSAGEIRGQIGNASQNASDNGNNGNGDGNGNGNGNGDGKGDGKGH